MTFDDAIIHNTSVCNKDKNNYYNNIFLEKYSNQLPKNNANLFMSYYHRNDASEETDVDKTSSSKECDICHCCPFLDK